MKKWLWIWMVWCLCTLPVQAQETEIDWSDYDFSPIEEELKTLQQDPQFYEGGLQFDDFLDLLGQILEGEIQLGFEDVLDGLLNQILGEWKAEWQLMLELAALMVCSGVLKNLNVSFGGSQVEQIAFYVVFGAAVTLLFQSFLITYQVAQNAGENITNTLLGLLPVLAGIQAASGGQVSATLGSGFLIGSVNLASFLVQTVFLNGILLFVTLSTVNQLTGQNMMKKIMGLAKVLIQKGIKGVSGIFLFLIGLQGIVAPAADSLVRKTMISAAGAVPVVGGAIGGAVETIFAGASLVGHCVGGAGMVILMCICLVPLGKLVAIWLLYKVTSALLSPIADAKMTELLEGMADGTGMLMGVLLVLIGMFVCGVGIFLRSM